MTDEPCAGSYFSTGDLARAGAIVAACASRGLVLATAESCTGGLVSALLTEIPGSSAVVDRAFVTYSNSAKLALLGVAEATLDAHGAVSSETAEAMARGALVRSNASYAIAVTGIAGPGGGSAEKPVGLVHFGLVGPDGMVVLAECRFGAQGRSAVRTAALRQALAMIETALGQAAP